MTEQHSSIRDIVAYISHHRESPLTHNYNPSFTLRPDGIMAPALRMIPFSVFTGIGFIALFGVAVLNGVVLMSYILDLR